MCKLVLSVAVIYIVLDLTLSAIVIYHQGGIKSTIEAIRGNW